MFRFSRPSHVTLRNANLRAGGSAVSRLHVLSSADVAVHSHVSLSTRSPLTGRLGIPRRPSRCKVTMVESGAHFHCSYSLCLVK